MLQALGYTYHHLGSWFSQRLTLGNDLTQETNTSFTERMDAFEPRHEGALQAYLRQAVVNRIRDERGVFSDIWASGIMRRAALLYLLGLFLAVQVASQPKNPVLVAAVVTVPAVVLFAPAVPPRIALAEPDCRSNAAVEVSVPPEPVIEPDCKLTLATVSLLPPIASVPPETTTAEPSAI